MTVPAGAVVKLYVDTRMKQLEPGDVIETGTGRRYEVVTARIQERGKWAGIRQHLTALVLPPDHPLPPDTFILPIRWYRR